jgi:hypothetical protein
MSDDRRDPARSDRRTRLPKLRCPICGLFALSHVIESLPNEIDDHFWRRRRCDACGETYTTKEIVVAIDRPRPLHLESVFPICHPHD